MLSNQAETQQVPSAMESSIVCWLMFHITLIGLWHTAGNSPCSQGTALSIRRPGSKPWISECKEENKEDCAHFKSVPPGFGAGPAVRLDGR